jgi:hypothetical protein
VQAATQRLDFVLRARLRVRELVLRFPPRRGARLRARLHGVELRAQARVVLYHLFVRRCALLLMALHRGDVALQSRDLPPQV